MVPTLLETHILFDAPPSSIEALLRCVSALGRAKDLPIPLNKKNSLTAWSNHFNPVTLEAHYVDKRGAEKRYPKLDSLRTLLQTIIDRVPDVQCWGTFSYSPYKKDPTEIDYFLAKEDKIIIDTVNVPALRRGGRGARCLMHLHNGKTLLYVYTHDSRCMFDYKAPKLDDLHSTDEVFREFGSLLTPHYPQGDSKAIDIETGERTNIRFKDPREAIESISLTDPALFNPRATPYGRNYADARTRIVAWSMNQKEPEMLIGSLNAEFKLSRRLSKKVHWEYPVSEDIVSLFTQANTRDHINSRCLDMEKSLEMIQEVWPAHIHKMCIDCGDKVTAEWVSMHLEDARGNLGRKTLSKRFNLVLEDGIEL